MIDDNDITREDIDKRLIILVLIMMFAILLVVAWLFSGGEQEVEGATLSDEPVMTEETSTAKKEEEGELSMTNGSLVINPIAVPIHSETGDYIGNALIKITLEYSLSAGLTLANDEVASLQKTFTLRLSRGDLFLGNSTILDLRKAEDALKALSLQELDGFSIDAISIESTHHQDP